MAAASGGKVGSGFAADGFRWSLEIPAEHLLSDVAGQRTPTRADVAHR
ncbi:hypothetical protein RA307_03545 [Xanthobacteraceae bacterium Astr-EGSB]|nr:hypothetical protein [Xanthobacteraceae bacterium Astr-EGSB]